MLDALNEARERLSGVSHVTPVMTSSTLDKRLGANVFFKCENFQRIGAFKFRGGWNVISQIDPKENPAGVIAYSSGNHAQAVALSSKLRGIPATLVMPDNAPAAKLAAVREYGATVVTYDVEKARREELAAEIQAETGAIMVPPFDHPGIVAGQGTASLELHEQVPDLDMVITPCGGGGLLSGTGVGTKGVRSTCKVFGVEPENADDAVRSFKTGSIQVCERPDTIADGTRTRSMSELTFSLAQKHVDDIVPVSEQAIYDAVAFFFQRMKLVVEPSGALGLAALLSGVIKPEGRIGIIISGGNVDGDTLHWILSRANPPA